MKGSFAPGEHATPPTAPQIVVVRAWQPSALADGTLAECFHRERAFDGRTTETYCLACGLVTERSQATVEITRRFTTALPLYPEKTLVPRRYRSHFAFVDMVERQRAKPEDPRTERATNATIALLQLPRAASEQVHVLVRLARRHGMGQARPIPVQVAAAALALCRAHGRVGDRILRGRDSLVTMAGDLGASRVRVNRLMYALVRSGLVRVAMGLPEGLDDECGGRPQGKVPADERIAGECGECSPCCSVPGHYRSEPNRKADEGTPGCCPCCTVPGHYRSASRELPLARAPRESAKA